MKFKSEHVDTLTDLLKWRRDVRHFRPDPVPEALVEQLRQAMDFAPSVGNSRPWRVVRVEDPLMRMHIAQNFAKANAKAASVYEGTQRADYDDLKLSGLDKAPLQLAVFTDIDPKAGHGLGRQTMPETLQQSTSMAIFALWLVARAHNLGVGVVSILSPNTVSDMLEIPETWRFSAYLCIGWPEFHDDQPLLHNVEWQRNEPFVWETR